LQDMGRRSDSQGAFLLALIEDCLEEVSNGAGDPKALEAGGAFQSLSRFFLPRQEVTEVARACLEEAKRRRSWDRTDPERIYLSTFCKTAWLGDFRARLFPFVPAVSSALRKKSLSTRSAKEKGEFYELTIAYLFETAGGFQSCLRALGPDAEN